MKILSLVLLLSTIAASIRATNCNEDECTSNAIWNKISVDNPKEAPCDFVCSEEGLDGVAMESSGGKCCCT